MLSKLINEVCVCDVGGEQNNQEDKSSKMLKRKPKKLL